MWPAALAAGAVIAGGQIGGGILANKASAKSAKQQMQFQKDFYKNRYKWQMKDMRRAGLNPILAAKMGSPPSAAGASYKAENIGAGLDKAVGAGEKVYQAGLDTQLKANTAQNIKQDQYLKLSQEKENYHKIGKARHDAETAKWNSSTARSEALRAAGYGDSVIGRQADSFKKIFDNLYDFEKARKQGKVNRSRPHYNQRMNQAFKKAQKNRWRQ